MASITMLKTRNFVMPGDRRQTTKFVAGKTYPLVKRAWADEMIAAGEAVEAPRRRRPAADANA